MGSNMFEGFMEGFTKTLGTGIMDQEKARLEEERQRARDMRQENLTRWQVGQQRELSEAQMSQAKTIHEKDLAARVAEGEANRDAQAGQNAENIWAQQERDKRERESREREQAGKNKFDADQNEKNRKNQLAIASLRDKGQDSTEMQFFTWAMTPRGGRPALAKDENEAYELYKDLKRDREKWVGELVSKMQNSQAVSLLRPGDEGYKDLNQLTEEAIAIADAVAGRSKKASPTVSPTFSGSASSVGMMSAYAPSAPKIGASPGKIKAPAAAEAEVKANPKLKGQFIAKFGYDPT